MTVVKTIRSLKVQRLRPPNLAGRRVRTFGRVAIPTAADAAPAGIRLNRYPDSVIGIYVSWGKRRYLSWVWPVQVTYKPSDLPWPDVMECHGWNPNSRTAMELHPDPLCPQCDDQHEHDWVAGPRRLSYGHGRPVRCRHCGARKCDTPRCTLRRHHEMPHSFEPAPHDRVAV